MLPDGNSLIYPLNFRNPRLQPLFAAVSLLKALWRFSPEMAGHPARTSLSLFESATHLSFMTEDFFGYIDK